MKDIPVRNMCKSRGHIVKSDSCLFYNCPGPQAVSKQKLTNEN